MEKSCIVCGKECGKKVCIGTKLEMQAVFCDEHSDYCDNCDSVECTIKD